MSKHTCKDPPPGTVTCTVFRDAGGEMDADYIDATELVIAWRTLTRRLIDVCGRHLPPELVVRISSGELALGIFAEEMAARAEADA